MKVCKGFEDRLCWKPVRTGPYCPDCQSLVTRERDYVRGSPDARGYDAQHRKNRKLLMAEAPWCVQCGTGGQLYADHITALSLGGDNHLENMQLLCGPHHWAKTKNDHAELERRRKAQ